MRLLLLTTLLTALFGSLSAQDSIPPGPVVLRAVIFTENNQRAFGFLGAITDSALVLTTEKRLPGFYDTVLFRDMRSFGYKNVNYVTFSKRNSVLRTTLTGLVIGVGIGVIIGYASGDDPKAQLISFTAGQKALGLGIFGGGVGTIAGLIVGVAARKTFHIHGSRERYTRMRQKMMVF